MSFAIKWVKRHGFNNLLLTKPKMCYCVFVIMINDVLPKCHKLNLEKLKQSLKQVDVFHLHKSFYFPTFNVEWCGVRHYHRGEKDKRWSAIVCLAKYDFLSSYWGIFSSLAISFVIHYKKMRLFKRFNLTKMFILTREDVQVD